MRSPICAFLGHVDAGKTSIMDAIRDTFFAYRETGGLTQNIGSTEVPTERINEIASDLLEKFRVEIKTPSIIFIDSPGHEAFVTLRERGASIADLAILTVDVTEGIQKQTIESIEILKSYKTPFIIAFTKIDRVQGCRELKNLSFLDFVGQEGKIYQENLDQKVYGLVSELSNYGFQAERYDRVKDFTKEVSIVPLSAVNNVGVKDLIVMIIGLSQRYISLEKETGNQAAIIEEKSLKGMGKVYDAIVYSGEIKVGDRILMQTKDGAKESKIKAIMKLIPLEESRENFGKYESVKEVKAAAPIRIVLQDSEALIGTSIAVFKSSEEKQGIISEINKSNTGYNDDFAKGIVVCADSLGSIDAIKKIGLSNGVEIGKTKLGEPTKGDIMTAKLNNGIILCFNVNLQKQTEVLSRSEGVTIINTKSIYELFERYAEFIRDLNKQRLEVKTAGVRLPGKIEFLEGRIFRRSGPCVFGVEVLGGEIRPNYPVINKKGESIGRILEIQDEKNKLERATKGTKVAISIDNAVYGRNVKDKDVFYTDMEIQDVIKFTGISGMLSSDYTEVFNEIQKIKKL
ncbi:MAG: translation initiation factor IF-2 [Candidatus Parvarchaeota archaeon]|nr:translation initiation factor IF-2 [Candidatus Parvarchaeota archaeon]